nr:MAG TPA: large terminase [Caudoviricetes sp.]
MIRTNILIVDEFVRTEKEVITRVFDPMLSDPRKPRYLDLTKEQKAEEYKHEELRKVYLSSIRRADEWSYKTFEDYVDWMTDGNRNYCTNVVSYVLGVKNGFISKKKVEDTFKSNLENMSILRAEYLAIPERGTGNSYFTYKMMDRARTNSKAFCCMSDEEYIRYKDCREKYPYYQEKLPNEIRLLCMDVAVIESSKNDNTAFFIIRLIPDSGRYTIIVPYADSMHGLNSIAQTKRMKQLFYEFECDYMILDTQGVGISIFDYATTETYDENRGVTYPAWTVVNPEDIKMVNRTIDRNAVPVIYSVKTPIQLKSAMFSNMRDLITDGRVNLLVDSQEGLDYMMKNYQYYKIEDEDLKKRLMNPYVQTNRLVDEAISLEQVVTQGYINLKEKAGNRKDRVMSLAYGLWYAKLLEDQYINKQETNSLLDWTFFG